jgi:trehalose 6-phosphate synthase/phosphatase
MFPSISVRDGMNQTSFEFVACQTDDFPGVLILSEFSGATQSLGAGALRVNPWDLHDLAHALHYALTMTTEERKMHHAFAKNHVTRHTSGEWVRQYLTDLLKTQKTSGFAPTIPPDLSIEEVTNAYQHSAGRSSVSFVSFFILTEMKLYILLLLRPSCPHMWHGWHIDPAEEEVDER